MEISPPDVPRLLTQKSLLRSDTVANAKMNRERGLSGVNSYQRDLSFDIMVFIQARTNAEMNVCWFDACCGVGRALVEARTTCDTTVWGPLVEMVGVDLCDDFLAPSHPGLQFHSGDVITEFPDGYFDLITIVHGLHYLGDKLRFLELGYASLKPGGLLIGHLDDSSVKLHDGRNFRALVRSLQKRHVRITFQRHLLKVVKTDAPLAFEMTYRGARVADHPNFSGMVGIDSWYDLPKGKEIASGASQ